MIQFTASLYASSGEGLSLEWPGKEFIEKFSFVYIVGLGGTTTQLYLLYSVKKEPKERSQHRFLGLSASSYKFLSTFVPVI